MVENRPGDGKNLLFVVMKVLIATGIYPPDVGGPATYSKYLAEELPKRGHDVEVLVYTRILKRFPKGISHFIYFLKVLKQVGGADVILTTDAISAGLPVHFASFFSGRPYVLKIGGDYVWEQAMQRWGVRELLDDFLKKKYGWKIQLMRKLQSHVAKKSVKVIAPSMYLASVVKSWGVPEEKISVIYNTIHIPKITRAKSNKPLLFSFGRDVPWKGFSMLREIAKELPEVEFRIGEVSHDGRDKLFAECDIFLLNTGYEGFSHQILEAMSLGLPIITTDAGGNKEIVEHEKNALVVRYNDKEAWIKAIIRLLGDRDLQRRLSENAKITAQKFLDKDMVGETLKVLQEVV